MVSGEKDNRRLIVSARSVCIACALAALIVAALPALVRSLPSALQAQGAQSSFVAQARDWNAVLEKYRDKPKVKQLVLVKCTGKTNARLLYYRKHTKTVEDEATGKVSRKYSWKKAFSCKAYIGLRGLGKKREGDYKTPKGVYNLGIAFGNKKNPGTKVKYVKVTRYHYWSGEKKTYNRLVKSRRPVAGEHLADYKKAYAYAIYIGYNNKCVYKKGSGIFLHCFSGRHYTAGCVAISEKNMKRILKTVEPGAKIAIYKK